VSYILEAQADGYWPQRLTNQVTGESEVRLEIELMKAPLAGGIVVTPTGQPAARATLVVCGRNEQAQMDLPGRFQIGSRSSASTLADAQGHFRLPPKHAPEVVVVAQAEGFAEVPFSKVTSNTVISLQPWGRIEGTAQLGGKPLVNETIRLGSMGWRMNRSTRVTLHLGATTDAEGRFAFETIPPGEWKVQLEVNKRSEGGSGVRVLAFSHGVPVTVRSGETTSATLGGHGRTVVGKAVAPTALAPGVWTENSVVLILKIAGSPPKPPKLDSFRSSADFQAANDAYLEQAQAYWRSETGLTQQRLQREYRAMFARDGSFRIDDVPPGDYTVKVNLTEPPKASDGNRFNFRSIASLERDVTIPELIGASDGTPVDLGILELSALAR
jgi:hypothetical protein